MSKLPKPENFWSKVNKVDDEKSCWTWTASKDRYGYGKINAQGKTCKAHRVSYEFAYGEIEPGHVVCHRCDNPACVRPEHLFSGITQLNNIDRDLKNRQVRGSRNGRSVLTEDEIRAIRRLHEKGHTQSGIAEHFNVTPSNISKIINKERWIHVDEELIGEPKEKGLE